MEMNESTLQHDLKKPTKPKFYYTAHFIVFCVLAIIFMYASSWLNQSLTSGYAVLFKMALLFLFLAILDLLYLNYKKQKADILKRR